ncbi:MAG: hypothetical protein ACR2QL_11505 [Woeseiaceae bacterium]
MTGRLNRSKRYIGGATIALLFGLSCSSAIAADAIKSACDKISDAPKGVEISTQSLSIKLVDHGPTDSAADMKAPAADPAVEKLTSPALAADTADTTLTDSKETSATESDAALTADELPETALRLPGVSEKELPRFRRQMYRTDI